MKIKDDNTLVYAVKHKNKNVIKVAPQADFLQLCQMSFWTTAMQLQVAYTIIKQTKLNSRYTKIKTREIMPEVQNISRRQLEMDLKMLVNG